MRLPGEAWLEFEIAPREDGQTSIRQTAVFEPQGLFGLAYWYALLPLHILIFRGMLRKIAAQAATPPGDTEERTPLESAPVPPLP